MTRSQRCWPYALLTLGAIGFILYGSLFPFDVRPPTVRDPLAALWATRAVSFEHMGNLFGNILFYMPLGLFGVPALRALIGSPTLRLLSIMLIASALCLTMELRQFWIVGRVSSFEDIYPNVAGAFIGGLLSLVMMPALDWHRLRALSVDPIPCALLLIFLAWRLFPYLPSVDLQQYWHAVKPVFMSPSLDVWAITSYAARWLVVAELIAQIGRGAGARVGLLFAMMALFMAKIVILNNSLSAAELAGAGITLIVWLGIAPALPRWRAGVVAMALLLFIVGERLQPFTFASYGQDFGWIPFASILHGSMAINSISLLEKSFLYASLIWLLYRLGWRLTLAGGTVASVLLATSIAQTHLPGRSAEITDALLALLLATMMRLIERARTPGADHR